MQTKKNKIRPVGGEGKRKKPVREPKFAVVIYTAELEVVVVVVGLEGTVQSAQMLHGSFFPAVLAFYFTNHEIRDGGGGGSCFFSPCNSIFKTSIHLYHIRIRPSSSQCPSFSYNIKIKSIKCPLN